LGNPFFTRALFPGNEFKGSIDNIGAVINEQSRAAAGAFDAPGAERELRMGMQANDL